ncbi:MAG: glycerol-3-phosphate 1-O-acyltransferase PlsY [Actinobacteria bacterium]|nr:glycerol-3-phosphate 1-O-acyltransferase PlsY [Actinomycetota bacterium]MCI0545414.1 glycerol-3-phosphate 1-O-acyltransferase PlsY [Actinomycetota bacterium]MCI0678198.1 glycerol-3-phosphate 1-O-acyltransferase PlsY [Actinomycetota bacterium]
MLIALAIVGAYVVGSVDFAVIVARMHGVDIHQVGSGNPGTSNVLRTLGRGPAIMVLVGDALKGVIGAAMGWAASGLADPTVHWAFAAGLAAVIGHCYPVFHRFRGGRGVATGLGVLLFTLPLVGVVVLTLWGVLAKVTKVASIASMTVVVVTVPLVLWQGVRGFSLLWLSMTIALVVWRHRANIARMARGGEKKVTV